MLSIPHEIKVRGSFLGMFVSNASVYVSYSRSSILNPRVKHAGQIATSFLVGRGEPTVFSLIPPLQASDQKMNSQPLTLVYSTCAHWRRPLRWLHCLEGAKVNNNGRRATCENIRVHSYRCFFFFFFWHRHRGKCHELDVDRVRV